MRHVNHSENVTEAEKASFGEVVGRTYLWSTLLFFVRPTLEIACGYFS